VSQRDVCHIHTKAALRFINDCAMKAYFHLEVNEDEWSASRPGRYTPGGGSFLVPIGLRALWGRRQTALPQRQRTASTDRRNYSRFGSASESRWQCWASQVAVPPKGHQDNTSDGDAARVHCLVFGRKTGRPGSRCEDNIKRNLKETAWEDGGLNSSG